MLLQNYKNNLKKCSGYKYYLYFCNLFINPQNLKKMAYKIDPNSCTACGSCIGECPVEAISDGDVYSIDAGSCTDCGACMDSCPVEAINPE